MFACCGSSDKTTDAQPVGSKQGAAKPAQKVPAASRLGNPPNASPMAAPSKLGAGGAASPQNQPPNQLNSGEPQKGHLPKIKHSDAPALLAFQEQLPLPEKTPNGKDSNAFGGPPDLKHNSPPSFKGFLTEKEQQLQNENLGIMDSQDIWKPKNVGGSSGSLTGVEKPKGSSTEKSKSRLGANPQGAAEPRFEPYSDTSVEKAEVGGDENQEFNANTPRGRREAVERGTPPKLKVSPEASGRMSDGSKQHSPVMSAASVRLSDPPRSPLSPVGRGSLSNASRASSIGSDSVRDSDSGARPQQSTKGMNLPGSPQDPGQAGSELYELVGQLRVGRTGTTKLMRDKRTHDLVAAKWVQHTAGETLSVQTEREIVNHRRLLHPNVVRFREVFATDEHLVIVMDYASVGHLTERIATGGALSEDRAKEFYRQLVDGMVYCHKQGIVHRNLRMDNMLLDGQYFRPVLKISGFGYSKAPDLDSAPKTMVKGSPTYSPPEILMGTRNEGYDGRAMDVWSSGIILYTMLTGNLPFQDPTEPGVLSRRLMQRIVKCDYDLPTHLDLSPECKDLLANIFVSNPKKRIDSYAVQNHPWLVGTALPKVEPVIISKQSESEISSVMERARKRKAARLAAAEKPKFQQAHFNEDLLDD